MNVYRHLKDVIVAEIAALGDAGAVPAGLDPSRVAVEPPRDAAHGDVATNAAMVLATPAGMNPRDLAAPLAARLAALPDIARADVAGPGFINLRLDVGFWRARLADILHAGAAYGDSDLGGGAPVNVEYVSANPTGPLHIGHARGAVVGDALAAVLEKAGWAVTREYYINDAGAQVDALARSVHLRYREALGDDIGAFPDGLYPGDYVVAVARALVARDGGKWRGAGEAAWLPTFRNAAIDAMMAQIGDDLAALGIRHAVFASERALVEAGAVDAVMHTLAARGLLYTGTLAAPKGKLAEDWEERPQTLVRTTDFGDDTDRPVRKSDGSWTYFATDLAYHLDKHRRGFDTLIDVWGADHGGYVKRVGAGVAALTDGRATLDVLLCQMVRLLEGGAPAAMSKRAGTFVALADLVAAVGRDVVRFIMLTRRADAPLDFDLVAVKEQSRDNPVFYVQYAHARCHSVVRNAAASFPDADLSDAALAAAPLALLDDADELALIRRLARWPAVVEGAALAREPHRIAFYLYDLAAEFHALWSKARGDAGLRFLVHDDLELSRARLALVRGVATVVASGLNVMGVEPANELRDTE